MTSLASPIGLDLRSLAVLRMGLGAIILVDLADRATWLRAHYTDVGVFPRAAVAAAHGPTQWSLHLATGSTTGQAVLFTIAAVLAALLIAGWRTRWVAVASWILLLSLHGRTQPVNYGADALLRAALFFALFLPIGARWSVDARRSGGPPLPDTHVSVASFGFIAQLCIIYVATGLQKAFDPSWSSLSAVYLAVSADHTATQFGLWLSQFYGVTQALTFGTLLLDLIAPLMLFVPIGTQRIRLVVVTLFIGFHVGTALSMHLGYFPWVSCLCWLTLLPSSFWERVGVDGAPGVHIDLAWWRALSAAGLALGLITTVGFTAHASSSLPRAIPRAARAIGMEQRWNMFIKPLHDGWFIAPGYLADGRAVDILRQGAPVSWEKPAVVADQFHNMRWRKYFTDLPGGKPGSARVSRLFLRYICRGWNAGRSGGDRMLAAELVFMQQDDRLDGLPGAVVRRTLSRRECVRRAANVEDDSAEYFEQKPHVPDPSPGEGNVLDEGAPAGDPGGDGDDSDDEDLRAEDLEGSPEDAALDPEADDAVEQP